jgi:hypothetical protein
MGVGVEERDELKVAVCKRWVVNGFLCCVPPPMCGTIRVVSRRVCALRLLKERARARDWRMWGVVYDRLNLENEPEIELNCR